MNSKLLFTFVAMTSISSYIYSNETEKADVKEQPGLQWREQRVYVYDNNQLTKLILTNFLQLCENDNPIEQTEISNDSSYLFSKSENYIRVHSVFEAREWKNVDHLKETLFKGRIDNHVVGILGDKCTKCDFIALYNYATHQPTLIASCDTLLNLNNPQAVKLVEEIREKVAAEKQQAKEKHEQSAKAQSAK